MPERLTILQEDATLHDPHHCIDRADTIAMVASMMEPLIRRVGPGQFAPVLAESWSVTPDAKTFRFNLRKGVGFHDGTPLTAATAIPSLKRITRPDVGAALGAAGVYSQYLRSAVIAEVSEYSLEIRLDEPLADLLDILVYGCIISPVAMEAPSLEDRYIGTGPYRMKSYDVGFSLELEAFADYHGGVPAYDTLRWECVPDSAERLEQIATGGEVMATGLPVATPRDPSLTYEDYVLPTAIIFMMRCNEGPLADARIRRALNLAIDREALIAGALDGGGMPLEGVVSSFHFGAGTGDNALPFDPEAARSLLREAGFGHVLRLRTRIPDRMPDGAERVCAEIARQLLAIGVKLDVEVERDRTLYANQVREKNIGDLCLFDSSPMSIFRVLYEKIDSRVRGAWWEGYSNPAVEHLLDLARATVDTDARRALYEQCFTLMQQDPPWIYLYTVRNSAGYSGASRDGIKLQHGLVSVRSRTDFDTASERMA